MKIENLKKLGPERILQYNQFSSNQGGGTPENPVLIEPSDLLPTHLLIKESTLNIHFKNCTFKSLLLKKCQNVTISKCVFDTLHLEKSSEIEVGDCNIDEALILLRSQQINVHNCNINHFRIISSYKNHVSNCNIVSSMNEFSRANIFKKIEFAEDSEKYIQDLLKSTAIRKIHLYIILILIAITILGTPRLLEIDLSGAVWFLSIMCLLILIDLLGFLLLYRKAKQYGPNKMI